MVMTKKLLNGIEIFDLEQFYKILRVAPNEQPAVTICFEIGLERYYQHIYGYNKYGKRPASLIEERLHEPYIFGFGAVEVLRHDSLSLETRLKIVQYAIEAVDVTAEYGIPHGLPIMASFLAGAGRLDPQTFRSLMIAANFGEAMFHDWQLDEVQRLFKWLITRTDMPEEERVWWLWHVCVNCEHQSMARLLAESLLTHRGLSAANKRALCQAWLSDASAGEPPPQWEAVQALLGGDVAGFAARAVEAGMHLDGGVPSRETILAEYDSAIEALIEDEAGENGEAGSASLHLLRKAMVGPLGMMTLTPGPVKRVAVLALPALGEDPLKVCKQHLKSARSYQADTVNQAVADVIRTYRASIPAREVRALVKQGLKVGGVAARKSFYQLGADLYGKKFWAQANKDSSKSVRDWAQKKEGKGAAKRRK
jgi:hypothetical protein